MKKFDNFELMLLDSGSFKSDPTLFVVDIPGDNDLRKGKLPSLENENQVFLFVKSYQINVKIHTKFDVLFLYSDIGNHLVTNIELLYSSVNPSYEIDFIPLGYTSLCLFEFEDGKPEMLNKLRHYMSSEKCENCDYIIFTQSNLLKHLL